METNKTGRDAVNDGSAARRTALFNRYVLPNKNLVYRLCIKYSRSSGDIGDNYNEVLANYFKYIETYDPSRSIQTWLHIVCKRFIHDLNIKRSAFRRTEDVKVSEIAGSLADSVELPENCMGMDNYRQLYGDGVLRALSELKPIYREALLLQQAGYRLHEIMEISFRNGNLRVKNIETVKSRLFLAKQQMRKLITRDGERRKD
ncbi:MAG: sigma-70 family RNA polymerase sigma factor [Tannerella sp.]|nr:sigma-70 family RNA polymerase sigma factor [Tannerella sp.]